jgi:hypothetical protein
MVNKILDCVPQSEASPNRRWAMEFCVKGIGSQFPRPGLPKCGYIFVRETVPE